MSAVKYKKRHGTSGIRGQLYESKLISLIYFRAKHNASVRDFLLASNMDEVGAFDDICLRVKLRGSEKPLIVFLQAKHRENDNSVLTLNSKHELTHYFYSYLNIRRAFTPQAKGELFEGSFEASECLFVMYTTAKDADTNEPYESPFSKHLNDLIATGKNGIRPRYKQRDVDFLSNIVIQEQVNMLAELLAKCICEDDGAVLSMNNELMPCYHVLLAQAVLSVGSIQRRGEESEHRVAAFRQHFFTASDDLSKLFRDKLVTQILKTQKPEEHKVTALLQALFTEPFDVLVLSELIESVVTYKQGKLHFVQEMDEELKQQLFAINVSQATVEQAIEMAAQRKFIRKTFKVPVTFGNNDLTIRGKLDVDIEHVLNKLSSKIVDLLRNSDADNVIIDDFLGDEFLQLNQGLASAVGNILIRDENSNSMKFTDELEALGELAKRLFGKVRQEIQDLHPYRLVVRTKQFPLLSFNIDEDGRNVELVKQEITTLAVTMAKFLNEEVSFTCLMDDELVFRYHVLLEQQAIDVSDIQQRNEDEEHRIASFRQDLFDADDELLGLFKHTLYTEMLKRRSLEEHEISTLLATFYEDTSNVSSLSKLIGSVVTFQNGKLQFVHETTEDIKEQLSRVNVSQSSVEQAIELAARKILIGKQFKVPAAFGNKDLTIKGQKGLKIERRLNHLKTKISELPVMKIVTIDVNLGDELVRDGLAGAVGNILVLDKETNLLKFVDDGQSLEQLSGMLFQSLQSKVPDMRQYRFDMKIRWIPKLSCCFEDEESYDLEKVKMSALAELFANFLCQDTNSVMSMDDEQLLLYHVILAEKVFDVSEIKHTDEAGAHRVASFRKDFFETNVKLMKLFRDRLYIEILKRRRLEENETMAVLTTFFQFPTDVTLLSNLIGNVVILKHGKLQFVREVTEELKKQLNKVSVTQLKVNEAIELSAKEILTSKQFKVPTAFGNKDLTITDKSRDATEVLNHLTSKLCDLANSPHVVKVATIDESLGDGLLKPSGGIGGLVGNLLVHDEDTKLLKFTDNSETLEELSRRLFYKLQSQLHDLRQYRFVVKAKKFPKLTFDSSDNDRRLVEDFLNRLLFFTSQADETRVGDILKGDIEDNICRDVNNFRVTSDALFLKYHDEIQAWWMDVEGDYLTKKSKKFEIAIKKIVSKPLMTVLGMMHQTRIRNNIECTFNDNVVKALTLTAGTVVVTRSTDLTVAKMIQRCGSQDHVVLDLEYVLNLHANEYNTLCEELRDTHDKKLLIVVCNHKPSYRNWSSRLKNVTEAVRNKHTVVVTSDTLLHFIKEYFGRDVVDDKITNLADLTADSQKSILKNAAVVFNGKEVSLELILDEESKRYVKGDVLNKVINNKLITISKLVGSLNYEKIKQVFIDREVFKAVNRKRIILNSLNDISDDVVILTAQPGMGKSTMLTYLSNKAKENDPKLWIVRVNLLDHSEQFNNWKCHNRDINILESLRFLCRVVLSGDSASDGPLSVELVESGGFVYLTHCSGDESAAFEIEMFLHYYNTKNVMFLFDGFDEICPHYAEQAMALFKCVKSFPRKHKMWITSRSYEEVKSILEIEFGPSFEIQNFSVSERNQYLDLFWEKKVVVTQLNYDQLNNLINFMNCISDIYKEKTHKKLRHKILYFKVCMNFRRYLIKEINKCPPRIIEKFKELLLNFNYDIMFLDNFDSPLHLYLVADYLKNQILHSNEAENNWNINDNALTIYDRFFEAKLKWIRFEEKNKILLSNSDNIIIYEHIREDFFKKHRQLGAYAIFHQDAENIFSMKEMREIIDNMVVIKAGKEKTGVICGVSNDIPIFLHMIFAEYFAVQHLCYILITEKEIERQRSIWDFILNVIFLKCSRNVRELLDYRVQIDDNLKEVIRENELIIFDLLLKQGKGIFTFYEEDVSEEIYLKIKAYLKKALDDDLISFISVLYNIKRKLTDEYLADNSRTPQKFKRFKLNALISKKKSTLAQSDDKDESQTVRVFTINRRGENGESTRSIEHFSNV